MTHGNLQLERLGEAGGLGLDGGPHFTTRRDPHREALRALLFAALWALVAGALVVSLARGAPPATRTAAASRPADRPVAARLEGETLSPRVTGG